YDTDGIVMMINDNDDDEDDEPNWRTVVDFLFRENRSNESNKQTHTQTHEPCMTQAYPCTRSAELTQNEHQSGAKQRGPRPSWSTEEHIPDKSVNKPFMPQGPPGSRRVGRLQWTRLRQLTNVQLPSWLLLSLDHPESPLPLPDKIHPSLFVSTAVPQDTGND